MPMKTSWLLRVPEIRHEVIALDVPVVDRVVFERLFHVRRRRAIEIMKSFGAYQTSQALLIDRAMLLRQLEALEAGTEFALEQGRKQRLADSLKKIGRWRAANAVRVPVAEPAASRSISGLPPGISLQAESLHMDFHGAEDLLGKLYERFCCKSVDPIWYGVS